MEEDEVYFRKMVVTDAKTLHRWWTNGAIMGDVGFDDGLNITVAEIIEDIEKRSDSREQLMICFTDSEETIGEAHYQILEDMTAEIGLKICLLSQQGKGLGQTSVCLLIDYIFDNLAITKIKVSLLDTNIRAQNLYRKIGFLPVIIKANDWVDPQGIVHDTVCLELKKIWWLEKAKKKLQTN